MCGIVGIATRAGRLQASELASMCDVLRHRGPDDHGIWSSSEVRLGLAHRRLAIIDLSAGGRQPIGDDTSQIVFNGEIYNFRDLRRELAAKGHEFRSATDTEVLLRAYREWGPDCVNRLNGMFAFCIYDAERRQLFLARDRAGEKPLYYVDTEDQFLFASELKALMSCPTFPRRLNMRAVDHYLCYGYVPGDLCILDGVQKLPPAHALCYDLDHARTTKWQYWQLPEVTESAASDEELTERLGSLLYDAVRQQLVADVPVAILLSGGVDSSLITAMAARAASGTVRTFTVGFPGHGRFDESEHARLVARHFATDHVELTAEPATVDLLPELAQQFDEPLGDSSLVPTYLVSRLIRQHATVALGGDGGDELFGGYSHYRKLLECQFVARLPSACRRLAEAGVRRLPLGLPGRNRLITVLMDPQRRVSYCGLFFDERSRERLLRDRLPLRAERERAEMVARQGSTLQSATRLDFLTYLPDDILMKVDRASMYTSLEVRAPWLDHRIIQFAFGSVPDRLKTTKHECKILPKRLARKLLPPQFDATRKHGFSLPLAAWFRRGWGDFMADVLLASDSLFCRRTVESLFRGQERGCSHASRMFGLTMFELWRRHYRVT